MIRASLQLSRMQYDAMMKLIEDSIIIYRLTRTPSC